MAVGARVIAIPLRSDGTAGAASTLAADEARVSGATAVRAGYCYAGSPTAHPIALYVRGANGVTSVFGLPTGAPLATRPLTPLTQVSPSLGGDLVG